MAVRPQVELTAMVQLPDAAQLQRLSAFNGDFAAANLFAHQGGEIGNDDQRLLIVRLGGAAISSTPRIVDSLGMNS